MEGQQEQKPDASARRRTRSKNRTTRSDPVNKPSPVRKQRRKTPKTTPNDKTAQLSTRLKRKNSTAKRQTPPKRKKGVREKEDDKKDNKDISQRAPNYPQPWGSSQKYVGAHLSIQGGIWKAVLEAKRIGARAFGLFLRSQRSWSCKPLDKEGAEKFQRACQEYGFESHFILPHSPYLMNLGSPKSDVFLKSRVMLVEELVRCQQLGLTMYNIHPGSCVGGISVTECVKRIADGINYAHSEVPGITVVLENMSCQGSTIGGRFEELRDIIGHVTDKSRIGVCLDTCHAFAAGHNLAEKYGLKHMLDDFSRIVGLDYLKAVHLNDSKGEVGCRLDRHENIGRGHIGLEGFRQIMNEPRFDGIPMILETPYSPDYEDYSEEIDLLYSLCADRGRMGRNL
ncbi:probable endonuclease 4 [Spea bombifrons]|uniref:probable endonuclease 4 n=1 Tax=Spea bombifrons TaxID=233779 RepID=UPI002349EE48|nr:probable endonuclease 4 [Spea bombifrons]